MEFKNLSKSDDFGKLALRLIFAGTLLFNYGFPTFYDLVQGNFEYANPLGIGMGVSKILVVFGQFFCAIIIMVGWKTRLACIPILSIFFIAFFVEHFDDPFEYKELSFLYLGAFLVLSLTGPGKYAIDHWAKKK